MDFLQKAELLTDDWNYNPRWNGVKRPYTAKEVLKLRGPIDIEYTLAKFGANKLWNKLHTQQQRAIDR